MWAALPGRSPRPGPDRSNPAPRAVCRPGCDNLPRGAAPAARLRRGFHHLPHKYTPMDSRCLLGAANGDGLALLKGRIRIPGQACVGQLLEAHTGLLPAGPLGLAVIDARFVKNN